MCVYVWAGGWVRACVHAYLLSIVVHRPVFDTVLVPVRCLLTAAGYMLNQLRPCWVYTNGWCCHHANAFCQVVDMVARANWLQPWIVPCVA